MTKKKDKTTMVDKESLPYRPCVGVVLFDGRGRVFVARRIDTPEAWQMPQGGIDKGEDPRDAALRELKEEIGTDDAEIIGETRDWLRYDLPRHLVGKVWKGKYRGQEQKWFALRFTGDDTDIDLSGTGHAAEFDAWKWAPIKDLPAMIVEFKRPVYEALVAEFTPLSEQLRKSSE